MIQEKEGEWRSISHVSIQINASRLFQLPKPHHVLLAPLFQGHVYLLHGKTAANTLCSVVVRVNRLR